MADYGGSAQDILISRSRSTATMDAGEWRDWSLRRVGGDQPAIGRSRVLLLQPRPRREEAGGGLHVFRKELPEDVVQRLRAFVDTHDVPDMVPTVRPRHTIPAKGARHHGPCGRSAPRMIIMDCAHRSEKYEVVASRTTVQEPSSDHSAECASLSWAPGPIWTTTIRNIDKPPTQGIHRYPWASPDFPMPKKTTEFPKCG